LNYRHLPVPAAELNLRLRIAADWQDQIDNNVQRSRQWQNSILQSGFSLMLASPLWGGVLFIDLDWQH